MAADQAQGLRRLFAHRRARLLGVVGAGATGLVLEIAAALAARSERVLLLDATCGEAAAALGLAARYELRHVMAGDRTLADVALGGPAGLVVLPAHRALATLAVLQPDAERLLDALALAVEPVDVPLLLQDLQDGLGQLRDRRDQLVLVGEVRVADPRQQVRDRVGDVRGELPLAALRALDQIGVHHHDALVTPGSSPACASSRKQIRQSSSFL